MALTGYAISPAIAQTLPQGGSVVGGLGTITQTNANQLTINQASQNLAIDWQSFSIGANNIVRFVQPSTSAVALNRVLNGDPSQIYGQIQANGQVVIMSPNGIVFGPNSRVDVNALVATTANISTLDFMSGKLLFDQASSDANARVVNQGVISVAQGGFAVLAAASVSNQGQIIANGGTVVLGGTKTFAIDFHGDGLLKFAATGIVDQKPAGADALVENSGSIEANGGRVLLTARAARSVLDNVINTTGIVVARTASLVNGEIVIDGGDSGIVSVNGTLDASGANASESGGTVKVLGEKVGLFENARIDASGAAGGGTVLVGGNYQGKGPEANAQYLYMDARAVIDASATANGDGGRVILWSDLYTSFQGTIAARGGAAGGNGGFVETSSKDNLQVQTGRVDATALIGRSGKWLLDPRNVTIGTTTTGGTYVAGPPDIFTPTANGATISVATIVAALNAGTSVEITTGSTGGQVGNILVDTLIEKTGGGTATLTLNAAGGIGVNYGISSVSGALNVSLLAGGSVAISAPISTNGGNFTSTGVNFSNTAAGTVSTGGGMLTLTQTGTHNISGNLSTAGGQLTLHADLATFVGGGTTISTGGGNLQIWANAPGGIAENGIQTGMLKGFWLASGATIDAGANSYVSIVGRGGWDNASIGVYIQGTVQATGATPITISGKGGTGIYDSNHGVVVEGTITGGSSSITLNGFGGTGTVGNAPGADANHVGVLIASGATISTTSGDLNIFGTGGLGSYSDSVRFAGTSTINVGGALNVTGNNSLGTGANIAYVMDALTLYSGVGGTSINAGTGSLLFRTAAATTGINIGAPSGSGLILTSANLATINSYTFGTLAFGDKTHTGGIVVPGAYAYTAPSNASLSIVTGGSIGVVGSLTTSGSGGITLAAGGTITISAGGSMATTGTGNIALEGANNVWVDGSISTGAGAIAIWGNAPGGSDTAGIAAGTVWGVQINATALISSSAGAISIVGKGATDSAGQHGIVFWQGGTVQSVSGAISLVGRGGDGTAGGMGIAMVGGSIQSASGVVSLTGYGAIDADGIQISRDAGIHSDSGTLTLTGFGAGASYGFRAQFDGTAPNPISEIGTAAGTGDINILADSMSMSEMSLLVQSNGVVSLRPVTSGTTIGIGDIAGTLQLPGYMGFVYAGLLVVGDSNAGAITIGASGFSNYNGTDLYLRGASIALNGNVTLPGETLTLYANTGGVTQAVVSNISADSLVLRGAGDFAINRNGIGYNNIKNVAANVSAGSGSGDIILRTGELSVSISNAITDDLGTVNGITTTGGLTWVSPNRLTQTAAGLLSVAGDVSLIAQYSTLDMSVATNSFGGQVAATSGGGGTILLKAESLALGTVTSASDVILIATNGGITQTGLLTASGNLNASANGGTLGLSSYQNVVVGSVSLATSGGANNLAWTQFGPMLVGSISSSGQLNLSVTNGGISQSGTIAAAGATTLSVDTGDIALTNAANAFVGAIAATNTVGGISLANTGNTLLGDIVSNGVLNVSVTGGTLSQLSGSTFSATGNATIALAGAYALSLTESGNNIGGNLTLSGSTGTLNGMIGGTASAATGTFVVNGTTIGMAPPPTPTNSIAPTPGAGVGGTTVSSALTDAAPISQIQGAAALPQTPPPGAASAVADAVALLTGGPTGPAAAAGLGTVVDGGEGGPAALPSGVVVTASPPPPAPAGSGAPPPAAAAGPLPPAIVTSSGPNPGAGGPPLVSTTAPPPPVLAVGNVGGASAPAVNGGAVPQPSSTPRTAVSSPFPPL
ncbi:MAG: filamentous hemagglutinin N-terminal domain-containing protein [Magnetospirillum sp.]|nr:filamentous hemagglutinin N-terminal domain-containing protein [Magnetospirillum sp.]